MNNKNIKIVELPACVLTQISGGDKKPTPPPPPPKPVEPPPPHLVNDLNFRTIFTWD